MDWADDITYSVHDLEDFFRAGLVPLHLLVLDQNERARFYAGAEKRLRQDEDVQAERFKLLMEAFERLVFAVPLDSPFVGTQVQRTALRTFTAGLIGRYVRNTRLQDSVPGQPLEIPPGFKHEVKMLKELTWYYVIHNPSLATQQYGQRKIIEDLFGIFYDAVEKPKYRHLLPHIYQEQLEEMERTFHGEELDHNRTRIVVDLISSMTERHALIMHRRLKGISLGSVLDRM